MEGNITLVITALQQLVFLLTVDRIRNPIKLRQRKNRVTKLKWTVQLLVLLRSCSQLVPNNYMFSAGKKLLHSLQQNIKLISCDCLLSPA